MSKNVTPTAVIIGGGPAGLMAAETLINNGLQVDVYDAMPSVGRKFLLAGKGGMNITHSEPRSPFLARYRSHSADIEPMLNTFGPDELRTWVHGLGIDTFVGTSGRVFPVGMKAAPLLRTWLHRMREAGVRFHMRHRWLGWKNPECHRQVRFATPEGEQLIEADIVLLALGGGSWARLGSDGAWMPLLAERGIPVAPLQPSNCGFSTNWSEHFRDRFAGHPLTSIALAFKDENGTITRRKGQFVVTQNGIEGSLIYAISALLRDQISADGNALIHLDLLPDWAPQRVLDEISRPRGSRSIASHLQSRIGIHGVKAGLLRELASAQDFSDPSRLASCIKTLPLHLLATRPLDEAISSAGGVLFTACDAHLMLQSMPGVFCAGEMLDWEAPTGGYLLTACFASGRTAALGALAWLAEQNFIQQIDYQN